VKNIDHYPKSIVKAIRYIKQDADIELFEDIKRLIEDAIRIRLKRS
jgi:hypothetical protein